MLPKYWRLRFINETGQIMTFNEGAAIAVRILPWKLVSGVLTYGTVIEDDMGFGAGQTIADDGESEGDVQDNTSNKYWGAHGVFTVTHDLDAAVGVCRLYFESCDDNSSWPSDSDDFVITDLGPPVKTIPIDNSAVDKSRRVNFVL